MSARKSFSSVLFADQTPGEHRSLTFKALMQLIEILISYFTFSLRVDHSVLPATPMLFLCAALILFFVTSDSLAVNNPQRHLHSEMKTKRLVVNNLLVWQKRR